MGFVDKIIHKLDDQYNGIVYQNDKIAEIKNNIQSLLNTNEEDCLCLINSGFNDAENMSMESRELCNKLVSRIESMIHDYEKRIVIISADYDKSQMPWKLSIDLQCRMVNDKFNEFHIIIDF